MAAKFSTVESTREGAARLTGVLAHRSCGPPHDGQLPPFGLPKVRRLSSQMVGFIVLLQKSVFFPAWLGPGFIGSCGRHFGPGT